MSGKNLPNRGIGTFCVMLRDDPIYQQNCAKRVAAGRADHLLKYWLEAEYKPPRKLKLVRRGRMYIVYPEYDADPDLKPDIRTPEEQKRWDAYVRSRKERLAEGTKVIEAARSRFPVLDGIFRPGVARERFVRRWRRGKVGKSLEIMILRVAATMEFEQKVLPGLRILLYERPFGHDPMARDRNLASAPAAASPTARVDPPPSPPAPDADNEHVVEVGGQEFVIDPDIGDGADP